jgi:hypothetical protein
VPPPMFNLLYLAPRALSKPLFFLIKSGSPFGTSQRHSNPNFERPRHYVLRPLPLRGQEDEPHAGGESLYLKATARQTRAVRARNTIGPGRSVPTLNDLRMADAAQTQSVALRPYSRPFRLERRRPTERCLKLSNGGAAKPN